MRVLAVPAKSLASAKGRLRPTLSPLERGALSLAMLEDVLDAAQAVAGWETWVVSSDEVILEVAARRGAKPLPEVRPSLSSAVVQVGQLAVKHGADALAVLPADIPLVTAEALAACLQTLGSVVIAPSRDRGGTNLLLRRPPRVMPARFGLDSYRRHLDLAAARGLPVAVVERRELSFDLDAPSDILALLETGRRGRTRQVCLEMDLGERLSALG